MSRVHYSFDSAVAAVATREPEEARIERAPRRPKRRSRLHLRSMMENVGLFAFGFGATNLLIHFAVGFFYAMRMSSALPHLSL